MVISNWTFFTDVAHCGPAATGHFIARIVIVLGKSSAASRTDSKFGC